MLYGKRELQVKKNKESLDRHNIHNISFHELHLHINKQQFLQQKIRKEKSYLFKLKLKLGPLEDFLVPFTFIAIMSLQCLIKSKG